MSTEHEQPTQEQIDAAMAMASLVPIKREMTSPEIDAWFSARDAVSAHARLGETNVETSARILAEAYKRAVANIEAAAMVISETYKSAAKPAETPGQKTLTFRTFQTPDGRPTCEKDSKGNESCAMLVRGYYNRCGAVHDGVLPTVLGYHDRGASYLLKPCDRCPLHNGKDDHAI